MTPAEATLQRVMELLDHAMEHAPDNAERYADEEHRLFHGYLQCADQELKEYCFREGFTQPTTSNLALTCLEAMEDSHEALTFHDVEDPTMTYTPPSQEEIQAMWNEMEEEREVDVDVNKSMRFNSGKPPLSFIMSFGPALEGIAYVMEYGAMKYERNNWKKGLDLNEIIDSMLRHLAKYLDGDYLDLNPETGQADMNYSGLPHIDHIAVNALFLAYHSDRDNYDGMYIPEADEIKCCGGDCNDCTNGSSEHN